MLVRRGLAVVLGDLAALGYDARWGVLGGQHVYQPLLRERIWILACANGGRRDNGGRSCEAKKREVLEPEGLVSPGHGWNGWYSSPEEKCKILGMADGVAGQLDRIHAIGNGQSPSVAALAWTLLK